MTDSRPWTWANWTEEKKRMEEECRARVYRAESEARLAVQEANERARRAESELHAHGLYDRHREMVERVAEEAAREAANELSERIASAVEDALSAFRDRLEKE